MRFEFIISKWANFYFFIQNLSEWHFSNRKDYNILWRKELGNFSPEEENALKRFKEIRLSYPSGKTFFEQSFFKENDHWQKLENNLEPDKYKIIKEIFDLFKNKFEILFKKDLPFLERWQKELNNKINEPLLIKSMLNVLNVVFNTASSEYEIKVNLLFSSLNHTGGGANIDNKSISLEISRYPIQNSNHAIGIIWHETIHLCFQNQYFFPLVLKQFPNDRQKTDQINEIIISSLFPRGILGVRLLKNKPVNKLMAGVTTLEQTIKILNLTKEYIDNQKPLDEKYIGTVAEIFKM